MLSNAVRATRALLKGAAMFVLCRWHAKGAAMFVLCRWHAKGAAMFVLCRWHAKGAAMFVLCRWYAEGAAMFVLCRWLEDASCDRAALFRFSTGSKGRWLRGCTRRLWASPRFPFARRSRQGCNAAAQAMHPLAVVSLLITSVVQLDSDTNVSRHTAQSLAGDSSVVGGEQLNRWRVCCRVTKATSRFMGRVRQVTKIFSEYKM